MAKGNSLPSERLLWNTDWPTLSPLSCSVLRGGGGGGAGSLRQAGALPWRPAPTMPESPLPRSQAAA